MNLVNKIEAPQCSRIEPFCWNGPKRRVAIVHYWLVGMRGGEKVLEVLCDLFPEADIFTLVCDPERLSPRIRNHKITTSFLQKIAGKKHYKKMLALMPFALESFDLTGYDLILSSEAGPAKGIIPRPDALHLCYCHSPMRYIWDQYYQYYQAAGRFTRVMMSITSPLLRQWDVTTAARVDHFIANSHYVSARIEKFYRRQATVIHPPVDIKRFQPINDVEDVYLCAGQITPYKRIDIAIDAFNQLGKRLDVVGTGVTDALRNRAGPTINFIGSLSDEEMSLKFASCKALIYPGVEDFGIIPIEVMASGRPVIAFARGGAMETIVEGKTGIFFLDQTADSLIDAILHFESEGVTGGADDFRSHVELFSEERFVSEIRAFIGNAVSR